MFESAYLYYSYSFKYMYSLYIGLYILINRLYFGYLFPFYYSAGD